MADYEVTHTTVYSYSEKVSHCQNIAYLLPQSDSRQSCERTELTISPTPAASADHTDYFGNRFRYFSVEQPHRQLSVTARTRIRTDNLLQNDWEHSPAWEEVAASVRNPLEAADIAAVEYLLPSPFITLSSVFGDYAAESFSPGRPVLAAALEFAQRIRSDFKYEQKSTTILTPLSDVFRHRRGVCQDFAHLAIAALRTIGIPARYVSGYIETYPPAGKPKLRGSDASHAWISVYAGAAGWCDFDPTNGKAITEEFIVTARGRDFGDVSPLKGILFGGGKHTLKVEVDVHRLT
ncbi:MAG: transglutaminase family protein [Spirochaetota bacterium]